MSAMCGRIVQSGGVLRLSIVEGLKAGGSRMLSLPPRYNGAPSQDLLVIRENHQTGERSIDLLRWGLIPHRCKDPSGGRKPINARAETVTRLPSFRDGYARRRCIVPVNAFYEWQATKFGKQPFAVAMANGAPFALGGIWENWKSPETGQWIRTFCILTTPANAPVNDIHQRMPLILAAADYGRWLGQEPDPADLLRTYGGADMTMWPISDRVNSPKNDDAAVLAGITMPAPAEPLLSHRIS
jgi:putative SOS response-associated peptidase YedK